MVLCGGLFKPVLRRVSVPFDADADVVEDAEFVLGVGIACGGGASVLVVDGWVVVLAVARQGL